MPSLCEIIETPSGIENKELHNLYAKGHTDYSTFLTESGQTVALSISRTPEYRVSSFPGRGAIPAL